MASNLLYPRLPPAVAHRLFLDEKVRSVATLHGATQHPDAVFIALGGTEVSRPFLSALADAVRSKASAAGFPLQPAGDEHRDAFDLACAGILYERMGLVAAEAAAVDVWAFVGAVLLPDVCFWRFPDPPEDRVIGPDLTRHTFARLWWRAHMLRDLNGHPGLSALMAISESEMNQLFERRSIGGNRRLVRSAAVQILSMDAELRRRESVRDAVRRLRRLMAFVMPESLADQELDAVMASIFGEVAHEPEVNGGPLATTVAVMSATTAAAAARGPKSDFGDALLADVPARIAELVRSKGGIAGADLAGLYEAKYSVEILGARKDLLLRLAWSAAGRHFIKRDEIDDLWLPGKADPASISQLGDWTINRIRHRAKELLKAHPRTDPWEQIVGEVYRGDGGRTPKVVMGIVGKLVNEVKRELKAK